MKKYLLALAVLLVGPSMASAAVGITVDGVQFTQATELNFKSAGSALTTDGSRATFNLVLAGRANGGVTSMSTTDTAVSTSYSLVKKEIGVQVGLAGTLADGMPGQTITIFVTARAGSGTFILTPTTKSGYASLTFSTAGGLATLTFVDSTYGWIVSSTTNVTINTPQ